MLLALAASLAISVAALIGSSSILLLGRRAERAAVWILSFAIGTLTATAALQLLPEALERRDTEEVMLNLVAGIVLLIIVERVIRWRHSHTHDEDDSHHHLRATAQVLLWGDALHNFIDGIVLGIAFSVSRELGLITAFAIFAHEVPQEIGDFAVLLSSGMERRRALVLNYLSAVTVVPGAILGWIGSSRFEAAIGWLLPIAAGGFLYIALADLAPAIHHRRGKGAAAAQIGLILAGVAAVFGIGELVPH
jgi:zinc and cadmium transporter